MITYITERYIFLNVNQRQQRTLDIFHTPTEKQYGHKVEALTKDNRLNPEIENYRSFYKTEKLNMHLKLATMAMQILSARLWRQNVDAV